MRPLSWSPRNGNAQRTRRGVGPAGAVLAVVVNRTAHDGPSRARGAVPAASGGRRLKQQPRPGVMEARV